MHINHRTTFVAVLMSSLGLASQLPGQPGGKPTLAEQRKRLAAVREGTSAEQVLKKLGKPDEVRRVPDGGSLDGVRYGTKDAAEVEQWAYGVVAKGMFARVGIVSLDRNRKVVATISPDVFWDRTYSLPERVPAKDDQAVSTPSKMSGHFGPFQYTPSEKVELKGLGTPITLPERLKTTVTLKTTGPKAFELKDDAARSIRNFLIIELCDAGGALLFRDYYLRYLSTFSFDPAKWPVLSVPAGREKSEALDVYPDGEVFGPLPAGKYSVRVYFPFEGKYYPSNLVSFEWKGREKR